MGQSWQQGEVLAVVRMIVNYQLFIYRWKFLSAVS